MIKTIKAPNWDLSDFYASIEDEKINLDLVKFPKIVKICKDFSQKSCKIRCKNLNLAIKKYEEIAENIGKISSYAYLIYAKDLSNHKHIVFSKYFRKIK